MTNTAAKKITYDGKPVQVESAVRDGTGKVINETYVMKPKIIEYTVPASVQAGYVLLAESDGTYDGTSGYVRFILELSSSSSGSAYEVLATWKGNNASATLINGAGGNYLAYSIGIDANTTTGLRLIVFRAVMVETNVKVTVIESSTDLDWKTSWAATSIGTFEVNTYWQGDIRHAMESDKTMHDYTNNRIDTSYVRFAEYTVDVSTSQQYHKAFSDLSLGTTSLGNARIPRQVEIYDPSGNQIQTDVKIDTTNSRITIYPTAVSPAETWTVRVTAW